jgi:branched-subunit amino acid ABC-type transport system permease component
MTWTLAFQLLVNGLVAGSLLGLVALGLALIFGVMRIVNFAHGEFVTLGAYLTWIIASPLGLSPLIGVPAAFVFGAAVGWAVHTLIISRVTSRPSLDVLMVTYALSVIGLGLFSLAFGGDFRSYSSGPSGELRLLGISIGLRSLTVLVICVALAAVMVTLLRSARIGLALRALAQNRDAAASSGIDTKWAEHVAFSVAVGLAAVAGALVSLIGTTTPSVGQNLLLDGFVVVVVGGLSSIPGALLAAFLIGLMQSVCGYVLDDAWAKIVTYALLYVVLVLRPQGLFGQKVET